MSTLTNLQSPQRMENHPPATNRGVETSNPPSNSILESIYLLIYSNKDFDIAGAGAVWVNGELIGRNKFVYYAQKLEKEGLVKIIVKKRGWYSWRVYNVV